MKSFTDVSFIPYVLVAFGLFTAYLTALLTLILNIAYGKEKKDIVINIIILFLEGVLAAPSMRAKMMSEWKIGAFPMQTLLLPYWFWLLCLLLSCAASAFILIRHYRKRKTNLSAMSVQEGFDTLPEGICFYGKNGMPLLVNEAMIQLCGAVTGKPLTDANLFWEEISDGGDIATLQNDKRTVQITRRKLTYDGQNIFELTSADITKQTEVNKELQAKNEELRALRDRLMSYSMAIIDLTREKEVLEAKMQIHDSMGQLMLSTRNYIQNGGNKNILLDDWETILPFFGSREAKESTAHTIQAIRESARAVGMDIEIDGLLPENPQLIRVFLIGAMECLLNASRHANAKIMQIKITEQNDNILIRYTNDGALPKSKIREGGGLTILRQSAESMGGGMTVYTKPQFAVEIILPKG